MRRVHRSVPVVQGDVGRGPILSHLVRVARAVDPGTGFRNHTAVTELYGSTAEVVDMCGDFIVQDGGIDLGVFVFPQLRHPCRHGLIVHPGIRDIGKIALRLVVCSPRDAIAAANIRMATDKPLFDAGGAGCRAVGGRWGGHNGIGVEVRRADAIFIQGQGLNGILHLRGNGEVERTISGITINAPQSMTLTPLIYDPIDLIFLLLLPRYHLIRR